MNKFSKIALIAALSIGVSAPVFAQKDPTAGTTNSDVTASTTTGASSTGAGHHTTHAKKHKKASSMDGASAAE
ncbi:hypothetical protein OVY01_10380 [Robbsia sp. Bb-Pol-6]|uniref:Uncharacterized protein n=1 Tax=Robbsia betulipollinis TaxID=2981849 RepID=A0ABT3ZMT1_9BURK|nr:hypothetical protein [Robbsia betulipollinis]MCY0387632.1 hypothetical protein [Robbsia betulipollinis]